MSNEREGYTRVPLTRPLLSLRPEYLQTPAAGTTVERIGQIIL